MFTDHEPTGTGKARWHLERALAALAIDVEAPMTIRTTDGVASRHPEPAAALWLLLDLEHAAVLAQTEQISRARAAGHSWDAIAGALDLGNYYAVRAEAAFAFATGGHQDRGERLDQPRWSVAWECPACGQRITDEGPFNGVREDEKGHRGDCPGTWPTSRARTPNGPPPPERGDGRRCKAAGQAAAGQPGQAAASDA